MATYSAGYLNVAGDAFFDTSGSNVTNFKTTNATVTNMTTNNLTATNFDFNNDLTVGGDLTIDKDFNLLGLNNYEGKYKPGDIIAYNFIGLMTTTDLDLYFSELNIVFPGAVPPALYSVNIYEVIYWGLDVRSSNITRMSGTLLVPTTIVSSTIVSYKHVTLLGTAQNITVWNSLKTFLVNHVPLSLIDPNDPFGTSCAQVGYVTIIADNPSYGVSVGIYNYLNPAGEAYSQYNAILATKQLMLLKPELVPTFNLVGVIPVIQYGYSLGGMFSLNVTQLIQSDLTNNLNVINVIAGAPVNVWGFQKKLADNPTLPTTWLNYVISLLQINGNNILLNNVLKPDIYNDVLPLLNQYYLNDSSSNSYNFWITNIPNYTYNSVLESDGSGYAYLPNTAPDPVGFVYPINWLNSNNYINSNLESSFYTNKFIDFTDISSDVPINTLYSQQDELCCLNVNNRNFGDSSNDMVAPYLSGFITGNSFTNIMGQTQAAPSNNLGRADYNETLGIVMTPENFEAVIGNIATNLITSELTHYCSTQSFDTLQIGGLNHTYFSIIGNLGVINYLIYRVI